MLWLIVSSLILSASASNNVQIKLPLLITSTREMFSAKRLTAAQTIARCKAIMSDIPSSLRAESTLHLRDAEQILTTIAAELSLASVHYKHVKCSNVEASICAIYQRLMTAFNDFETALEAAVISQTDGDNLEQALAMTRKTRSLFSGFRKLLRTGNVSRAITECLPQMAAASAKIDAVDYVVHPATIQGEDITGLLKHTAVNAMVLRKLMVAAFEVGKRYARLQIRDPLTFPQERSEAWLRSEIQSTESAFCTSSISRRLAVILTNVTALLKLLSERLANPRGERFQLLIALWSIINGNAETLYNFDPAVETSEAGLTFSDIYVYLIEFEGHVDDFIQ